MRREIAALTKNGSVSQAEATALVETRNALQAQTAAQDKAKQSADALAGSISSALTDSLRGLIDGSMSAEEALSNAFKKIGDAFLDMAFQMIQEWIKMQIIGLVGNFFGGGAGGLSGGFTPTGGWGNFGSVRFAEGGYVTGPTPALIGEGGESEYVIPESKMAGAMSRYSRGSRGPDVIPGSGKSEDANPSGGVNISYRGPMLNFNGDEYLPKSAVPELINAAAKRGAAQGTARTMSTLRNSRSQRSKLGL